jgi:hypothetical protein
MHRNYVAKPTMKQLISQGAQGGAAAGGWFGGLIVLLECGKNRPFSSSPSLLDAVGFTLICALGGAIGGAVVNPIINSMSNKSLTVGTVVGIGLFAVVKSLVDASSREEKLLQELRDLTNEIAKNIKILR